jgi:hypothetical protein
MPRFFVPLAVSGFVMALVLAPGAFADEQTEAEKADAIRQQAKQKAKSQIGYPDAYDVHVGGTGGQIDYYLLSQQISRLASFIQAFGQSMNSVLPSGLPDDVSADAADTNLESVYGPEGPTVKSVTLFLEYRLMVAGNPRLKVGKVTEDESRVFAQVSTRDGALVEEYAIDKKTGKWTPIR